MKKLVAGLMLTTFLVSCGGTPPFPTEETASEDDTGDGTDDTATPITGDRVVPPGTTSPSPALGLFRNEARDTEGENIGNGYANEVRYDAANDTFSVNNLGFDGFNTYQRGTAVGSLNGEFQVYEGASVVPDSVTGAPISQFTHRAIYGVSRLNGPDGVTPTSSFAIVRTGNYIPYGFGGFVYQREGSVTLPATGQAEFKGKAAGIRDFNGDGGLQYSTGDMRVAIDFNDFDDDTGLRGDAVLGELTNREIYDINGNNITQTVLDNINESVGNVDDNAAFAITTLPAAVFTVGPGVLDNNGDLIGSVTSTVRTADGGQQYESGKYYAIVSGDDPDEIVGVLVMENTDDFEGATTRDTSGFIVYRDPAIQP